MTLSTYKKYSGMFELFKVKDYRINIIEPGTTIKSIENLKLRNYEELDIKVIQAKHFDIVSDISSVGFAIRLNNHFIIYTGDSGVNEDVVKIYKDLRTNYIDDNKKKTDDTKVILLSHLGGFKEYERQITEKNYDHYYTNHLGRIGIAKLVEILNPDYCLISEYGEEFKGYRIKIAEIFDTVYKNTKFIPCDIGLKIFLERKEIKTFGINEISFKSKDECNCNEKEYGEQIEKDIFSLDDIKSVLLNADSSIHYYNKSNVSLNDLTVYLALKNDFLKMKSLY